MHYEELVERYGTDMAYDLLLTIEKLAKIENGTGLADMSEDERLQVALQEIDQNGSSVSISA